MGESESKMMEGGAGFGGLRVVSFESRMSDETRRLVEKSGGIGIPAPSMREIPIDENPEALEFAEQLIAGRFDITIFLTGVGTKILFEAMTTRFTKDELVSLYPVAENKVAVIHGGIDESFRAPLTEDELLRVRYRFHLPEKYILTVGTWEPRKNLVRLLQAWRTLRSEGKMAWAGPCRELATPVSIMPR